MDRKQINHQLPLVSFTFKPSSRVVISGRLDMESRIVTKAFRDETFREALMNNAARAIENAFDIVFDEHVQVNAVQESPDRFYLVLPHNPYEGVAEADIETALGAGLRAVAGWTLEQHRGIFPENKEKNIETVYKAWTDPAYKRLLLADAKLILETELGVKAPGDVQVEVLEETANQVFVVIPETPADHFRQLEVDTQYVNMPMVIGSHQNTAGFLGSCDKGNTHTQALFCVDTRSDSLACRKVITDFRGYNGCGGKCTFFSLIPG